MVRRLAGTGILSIRVPVAYGGLGRSIAEVIGVVTEIATAGSNIAQSVRAHFGFVERLLSNRATEADRQRWFPEVLAGRIVGNAISETAGATGTTLSEAADGTLRLDGRKFYSTGSLYADLFAVSATRYDGREVHVILPTDRAGIELFDDWDGFGQRLTASGSSVFTDVLVQPDEVTVVPADQRLGHGQSFLQLYLTAVAVGVGRAVLRDTVAYVRDRARPAAHAIADTAAEDPYVLEAVGEIDAWSSAAGAVTAAAARALDRVVDGGRIDDESAVGAAAIEVARAQLVAERLTIDAATRLFDTAGASATSRRFNLDRHWRNARTLASHNPLAYKARAIGDHAVNGALPPRSGYF